MNRDHSTTPRAALGHALERARLHRGLTQRKLAARAGVGRVTLANLESGSGSVAALVSVLAVLEHIFAGQPQALDFGLWLAQQRKQAGLSQDRLCALAGVSKPALVKVEHGRGQIITLTAVMTALELPLALRPNEEAASTTALPLPAPTMRILEGDCRVHMRDLAAEGALVDAIVTDPPYHLTSITRRYSGPNSAPVRDPANPYRSMAAGFMNQTWDGGRVAFEVETWRAAYDVLKPGGFLVAFGGTRTFHRLAVAIEDAGFEVRDTIMWVHGQGFPKSHNVGRGIQGLKRGNSRYNGRTMPSEEGDALPGSLMRRMATGEWSGRSVHVTDPEAHRWLGHGTALKPAYEPILIARKPIAEASVAANVLRFGTGGMNIDACRVPTVEVIERERAGRKPGVSVSLSRPLGVTAKSPPQSDVIGRWPANIIHDGLSEPWGRYFYAAKASPTDRGLGNRHPTVKPGELMRYLVRLVTPPGGTIFDPFFGSGSTGKAAVQEGFSIIGCELSPEFAEIARARIAAAQRAKAEPTQQERPARKKVVAR